MLQAFSVLIVAFTALISTPSFATNPQVQQQAIAMIPAIQQLGQEIENTADILATSTYGAPTTTLNVVTQTSSTLGAVDQTPPAPLPPTAPATTTISFNAMVGGGSGSYQVNVGTSSLAIGFNCSLRNVDSATLTINGQTFPFAITSIAGGTGDTVSILLPFDQAGLQTGMYPYTVTVNSAEQYISHAPFTLDPNSSPQMATYSSSVSL